MPKPTPSFFLDDDLVDGGDLGACPEAGLCCPNDPLDEVIGCASMDSMLDDGFWEELGPLPLSPRVDDTGKAQEVMAPDTGALAALCEDDAPGGQKRSAFHMFDSVPQWFPPPPTPSLSRSPTSYGPRILSPTSGVAMIDEGFLEDLGLDQDWSLPGSRRVDDTGKAQQVMEPNTGALAALCEADAPGGRKMSACNMFDSLSKGLPRPQTLSRSCSPKSSARRSLSPTPGVTELQGLVSEDELRWTLHKKPYHRRVVRMRKPCWTLALPLALFSPAARGHGNGHRNKNFKSIRCSKKSSDNGLPRTRTRQKRSTKQWEINGELKTCTHCRATETPQWRAGPDGDGTLCNACGIRYKDKRLYPEYRPSNSPDFNSNEHSNRHRNVERIRERKKAKMMAPEVLP